MTGRGWLTPNSGATETLCRPIFIPLDDALFFLAAVNGALNELTKEYNWEAFGDLTPAEAAAAMLDMYTAYATFDGCTGGTCYIPPVYDIDVGEPLKIIRLGDDGFTEEFVDGVWQAPTGTYEVPAPAARGESTMAQRLCAAAANAAAVMEQFYEEATDAYSEFGTAAEVANAILDIAAAILGAFGQVTIASYISFGQSIFRTFFDVFGLITGDVWTTEFTNEFECILLANASEVSSVVSFDFEAIHEDLNVMSYSAGLDLNRQLLIQQLHYLINIVAAGGLNVAGGTTGVASPDCSDCNVWCYYFDFEIDDFGWSIRIPPDRGFYNAGVGFQSHYNDEGATDNISVYCRLLLSAVPITQIQVTYNFTGGTPNTRNLLIIEDAVTLVDTTPVAGVGQVVTWNGTATTSEIGIQIVVSTGAAPTGGPAIIKSVLLRGTGANPFGDDNCT